MMTPIERDKVLLTLTDWQGNDVLAKKFAQNISANLCRDTGRGSSILDKALPKMHARIIQGFMDQIKKGVDDPEFGPLRAATIVAAPDPAKAVVRRHMDRIVGQYYMQCSKAYRDVQAASHNPI